MSIFNFLKKYLFILTALICPPGFAGTVYYPKSLEGNYTCKGVDGKTGKTGKTGKKFQCQLRLTKTKKTYTSHENCGDGATYIGTALYNQSKHVLAISVVNVKKPMENNVALVNVKPDGNMTSTWIYADKVTLGHSRCTRDQ